MSDNQISPLNTRFLAIYFNRKTTTKEPANPSVDVVTTSTETTFAVGGITIVAILGAVAAYAGVLENLGSFLASLVLRSDDATSDADADAPVMRTQFVVTLSNFGCSTIDLTNAIAQLQKMKWKDSVSELTANIYLHDSLTQAQLLTLLNFRQKLPSCDALTQQTLLMLDRKYGSTGGPTSTLLNGFGATPQGDNTGSGGGDDPQSTAWAKGLFNRITTGGPNGSMAGKIAVNFMSTVPVAASFDFSKRQLASNVFDDTTNPLVQILKDAVTSAAQSAAQGLADYLKTLRKPTPSSDETSDDRQTATVVKGIKDSMPATGKTVAQLAVFNALGNKEMAKLPRDQQLRMAYTVANATRAAVEATGSHIADLYQTDSIPNDSELAAVGARGLLDFLKSVGTTVANGVMQAAPVVLNAVINSANANNALGSALPPSAVLSTVGGLHELDTPTKIILASRIVNGTPNPESTVVTDKAVSDLADRQSNLGAQATLDTFTNTQTQSGTFRDSEPTQEQRNKFRDVALEVANVSPTFSNVTDIGATNLVTDTALKHADALRQNTLEMGIRSCANMIADHQSAEILYKVHLYRLKNGLEVQPRSFLDFLKTAVPIAANVAKAAAPALLALL